MKRPAALVVATLIVAALSLSPAPARAAVDTCGGRGQLELYNTTGLGMQGDNTADFEIELDGQCLTGATSIWMTGTLSGSCALMSGSGTAGVGLPHGALPAHEFSFTGGLLWALTGQVVGTLMVVEDPTDSPSCRTANAVSFIVGGSFTLNHL